MNTNLSISRVDFFAAIRDELKFNLLTSLQEDFMGYLYDNFDTDLDRLATEFAEPPYLNAAARAEWDGQDPEDFMYAGYASINEAIRARVYEQRFELLAPIVTAANEVIESLRYSGELYDYEA